MSCPCLQQSVHPGSQLSLFLSHSWCCWLLPHWDLLHPTAHWGFPGRCGGVWWESTKEIRKEVTSALPSPTPGCAMSGLIADAKTLIDKARVETQVSCGSDTSQGICSLGQEFCSRERSCGRLLGSITAPVGLLQGQGLEPSLLLCLLFAVAPWWGPSSRSCSGVSPGRARNGLGWKGP